MKKRLRKRFGYLECVMLFAPHPNSHFHNQDRVDVVLVVVFIQTAEAAGEERKTQVMAAEHEERGLSLEDKLRIIDEEIRLLHEFCTSKGFEPQKVELCASPLFQLMSEERRRRAVNLFGIIIAVLAVLAGSMYIEPVYKISNAYAKRAAISVSMKRVK